MKKIIKNNLFKLSLFVLKIRNNIFKLFKKCDKSITIVSSKKYKNKIKEDINLEYHLLKMGVNTSIKEWDAEIDDNIIIRSVYGYQNSIIEFRLFLENINKIIINNKKVLLDNIDKQKQYELFCNNNIDHINTKFVNNIDELNNLIIDNKLVIKPIISASGDNTFLINNRDDIKNVLNIYKSQNISNVMVQPFIEEIKNGELSIIVIDKKVRYAILRYPGIFTSECFVKYISIDSLEDSVFSIANKIINLDIFKDNVFMRIDLIKIIDSYKILELELLDPQLFIETLPNKVMRNNMYDILSNSIIKHIN